MQLKEEGIALSFLHIILFGFRQHSQQPKKGQKNQTKPSEITLLRHTLRHH